MPADPRRLRTDSTAVEPDQIRIVETSELNGVSSTCLYIKDSAEYNTFTSLAKEFAKGLLIEAYDQGFAHLQARCP